MAKKSKGRSDAATTRKMQADVNRRMRDALAMSGDASAGIREGMDYGRFPGTAGDRMQTEREDRASRRKEGGAVKKNTLAPAASKRPTPRPSTAEERAAAGRADSAAKREAGMKAGGKVKKMAMGGKCRGMGAATRGGNFSRG